jgi:DNA-binding XRE family transcriptional regulator
MSTPAEIGRKLRAARGRLKLSQGELALKAGVARQTIEALENGRTGLYGPQAMTAGRLAEALGIPIEDIMLNVTAKLVASTPPGPDTPAAAIPGALPVRPPTG